MGGRPSWPPNRAACIAAYADIFLVRGLGAVAAGAANAGRG